MNNLTLLETILFIYIIVANVSGFVAIIMTNYASNKASDIAFSIFAGVALPLTLFLLIVVKLKRKKERRNRKWTNH